METTQPSPSKALSSAKVVVATTVALSFISFWRGAAIVLSDLASSMFYAGGIAEQAIGKSAAWYVLGVMLFSFAVRSVYMESCGMFVRGGVYVVVRDSMGPMSPSSPSRRWSSTTFSPGLSVRVSAGQYLGDLINELASIAHQSLRIDPNYVRRLLRRCRHAVLLAAEHQGHPGIQLGKALRIMQITTVMVVAFC